MTHRDRLQQAQQAVEKNAEAAAKGRHRQKYHFMPPSGWMNDPNGCIWFGGKYHLFYQHNPYAPHWGSMHWGHATSPDLLHWQHCPIALAPSETYDDHPEGGVFSGSAILTGEKLNVFYTATANHGQGFVQTQCLATSTDGGLHFTKYPGNPVIREVPPGVSPDFRDPKVLFHEGLWYMVVGASLGGGAWHGGEGCALLYQSRDLTHWEYCGILARSEGQFGSMWECPDLFPLGGKWVLTFSPMFHGRHRSMYFVGEMDFAQARFFPQHWGDLDHGAEYYALQSLQGENGRVSHIAWQNGWDWMEGWQDFGPTAKEGWCGCAALPRVLSLGSHGQILQAPVPEAASLRKQRVSRRDFTVQGQPTDLAMPDPCCYELELLINLEKTTAKRLHLDLRADETHRTRLTVNFAQKRLLFDRNQSDDHSSGLLECPLLLEGPLWRLQVFSDTSSVELFCDRGLTTMSNTIYPCHTEQKTFLSAEGGAVALEQYTAWALDSIW